MAKKPLCGKCQRAHWNIIACSDVEAEDAREAEKQAAAVKAATPFIHRNRPSAFAGPKLTNVYEIAPGVYGRKRPDPPSAA